MSPSTCPATGHSRRVGSDFTRRLAFAAALATVVSATPAHRAGAQHPLVALPLEDPAYVQLAALERQGCAPARVSPYRPYTVGAVRDALAKAGGDGWCAGDLLLELQLRFAIDSAAPDSLYADGGWVRTTPLTSEEPLRFGAAATLRATALTEGEFRPLWQDVVATEEGTPPVVGTLRGRMTWAGARNLVAVAEAYGQTHRRNDPLVRGRALRNTSGVLDVSEAYLTGRLAGLLISFGRGPEAWLGEGTESLALSAHGPPLDRLSASIRWRSLEGRALIATLSDVTLTVAQDSLPDGTPARALHRMLMGHALTWTPSRSLELTVGETALLARGGTLIDLAYANPLMPYVVTQNDSSRQSIDARDNLGVFFGVRGRAGGVTLVGELFVDDIQIDAADRELFPDQLAWRIQAVSRLPLTRPTSLSVEYRRSDSFTYRRALYSEVYQQFDRPLGSELGPDADLARASAEFWPGARVRLAASVGAWRHGAVRLDARPAQSAAQGGVGPFPRVTVDRPAVQRAVLGDASVQFLSTVLPLTARVEAARIDDVNNQFAPAALYVRAQLIGTYAFRYP